MRIHSNAPSAADSGQAGHGASAPHEWPHDSPFYGLKIEPGGYRKDVGSVGGWMQTFVAYIHACLTCDHTLWISGAGHWSMLGWQSSLGLQLFSHQPQRWPWSSRPQHWEQSELPTLQLYTSTRGRWKVGERQKKIKSYWNTASLNVFATSRLLNSLYSLYEPYGLHALNKQSKHVRDNAFMVIKRNQGKRKLVEWRRTQPATNRWLHSCSSVTPSEKSHLYHCMRVCACICVHITMCVCVLVPACQW